MAKFTLDRKYWPGPVTDLTRLPLSVARLLFPPLPMVCLLPTLLSSAGVRVHVKEDSAGDNMVEVCERAYIGGT